MRVPRYLDYWLARKVTRAALPARKLRKRQKTRKQIIAALVESTIEITAGIALILVTLLILIH